MLIRSSLLASIGLASLITASTPREALACGGCFHSATVSQSRSTQVTGHRMALSVSNTSTTLWDQISYVGDPAEFAWVLPIRGPVEVGVSSDAMFAQLEALTAITVDSPVVTCDLSSGGSGTFNECNGAATATSGSGSGTDVSESEGGSVEVIAESVVGPYETVQLSSSDPIALKTWLTDHGYALPTELEPIVDAYVAESFDFLAVRLIPGAGINSMRPIRVTTPGPTLSLPLRMVAAGTGAKTALSLFVVSEGMYVPSGVPWDVINPNQIVWNFDEQRSNYATLRASYFFNTGGLGWLAEAGRGVSEWGGFTALRDLASTDPVASGYGAADGTGAAADADADIAKMVGDLALNDAVVTHLTAELSRPALLTDLELEALAGGLNIPAYYEASDYIGDPCAASGFSLRCHDGDFSHEGGGGSGADASGSSGACACDTSGASPASGGIALMLAGLLIARKRRSRGATDSR